MKPLQQYQAEVERRAREHVRAGCTPEEAVANAISSIEVERRLPKPAPVESVTAVLSRVVPNIHAVRKIMHP